MQFFPSCARCAIALSSNLQLAIEDYIQKLLVHFINLQYQQSKMFFGKILNQGQSFKFNPQDAEEAQGEVLSITNVVLAPNSKESVSLFVKNNENEEFLIATLTKERPQATINLFISLLDEVILLTKGNGSLHLTGFYEPDEEAGLPEGLEDEEEDEEEEEEEAVAVKAAPAKVASPQQKPQSPQQKPQAAKPVQEKKAPAPAPVKAAKPAEPEEDEDEEDEDEVLGEDDEDLDDDLEDEEDEDEEDEEEEEAPKPKAQQVKPQQSQPKPQGNQQQGGKPFGQGQQGGKPFNRDGGNKNWKDNKQGGYQGNKPHFNNREEGHRGGHQGGKPHFNNREGGNKNWNNNKGGKPFNKGGKPFNKGGKPFHKN